MSSTSLKINGREHVVDVDPDCPLLYVLRDNLAMNNPRFGCGLGQCGACTVLMDHRAGALVHAAGLARRWQGDRHARRAQARPSDPHPVQKAFIDEQAFQCGYCLNGWVLTAKALLDENPHPTDAEMRTRVSKAWSAAAAATRGFSPPSRRAASESMKGSA